MKKAALVLAAFAAACGGPAADQQTAEEPPMLGIHWTRDVQAERDALAAKEAGFQSSARRSANMTYHGGKIMTSATTKAFFRGASWGSYSGDKMTGIDTFYTGYSNSNYARTCTEYTGSNGTVGTGVSHQGHYIDTAAETSNGSSATVLAEVCAGITASGTVIDPSGNGSTRSTPTSPAARPATAPGTRRAPATARRSSSPSSGSSTATRAATPPTARASTRRASPPSPTSAGTSWPRR